jgi:hypothetical protein
MRSRMIQNGMAYSLTDGSKSHWRLLLGRGVSGLMLWFYTAAVISPRVGVVRVVVGGERLSYPALQLTSK